MEVRQLSNGQVDALVQRPRTLRETGLSELYVADLVSKHLFARGVLDLQQIIQCTLLPGSQLEQVFALLREQGRAEIRGAADNGLLRFALTERGRIAAREALDRDGYVGPAPVPLDRYTELTIQQAKHGRSLGRDEVHSAFADVAIRPDILDRLGPAMRSRRPIFIYGEPGTGKTFIARKLARVLGAPVLIPHALLVADKTLRLFDSGIHEPVSGAPVTSLFLDRGRDPRYVLCKRPLVTVGGELTLDMLEVQYDDATRIHHAPAQLQANNGMLVIDDLGRQRVRPEELFNRWIVPMEESRDYLTLRSGQHFAVPFEVALVFSSNRHPMELADPAFLRRIGYKIRFDPLSPDQYRTIWRAECRARGMDTDEALASMVIGELHRRNGVALLPCHPRDLIGLAGDYLNYTGQTALTEESLRWAWQSYFMESDDAQGERS